MHQDIVMTRNFILIILLLTIKSGVGQTSLATLFTGQWKNCGDYSLSSKSILLFKTASDTCDALGGSCPQTKWDVQKPDSSGYLKAVTVCSCKTKLLLTCGTTQLVLSWSIDEKTKTVKISNGSKDYLFKIKTLTKDKLELIKV
jgi:hypothetical protein